jgi:hypothetical protein
MQQLITDKLKARFEELSDPAPQEYKIDPIIVAKFVKGSVSYYAIAYNEERNELCCYVSDSETPDKTQWIKVEELEREPLFGKAAKRDMCFTEVHFSNIEIVPNPDFSYHPDELELEQMKAIREDQPAPTPETEQDDELDVTR